MKLNNWTFFINNCSFLLFFLRITIFFFSFFFSFFFNKLILEWSFFLFSTLNLSILFFFDFYRFFFSGRVLLISSIVIMFRKNYIYGEKNSKRFFFLVISFILSIQLLIFIPHLLILLLGWDGLGLSSFLLIIYYKNSKSLGAGILTLVFNRLGDVFLLISISLISINGHWLLFNINFTNINTVLCLLVCLAAITKRAQVPFSSWLPAAMAAPTPVSALVHSRTLVTAGVFILFRFFNFIFFYFNVLNILFIISRITILIAGTSAIVEIDIKKVIALSTLSNLGIIVGSLSLGLPYLAFFHLITHAIFKALLFICAGYFIDFFFHRQDVRFLGDVFFRLPSISSRFIIANMSLCGFPFLSGFYSKDLILESIFFFNNSFYINFLYLLGVFLTISYTIRLFLRCINCKYFSVNFSYISSKLIFFYIPIILLRLISIIVGIFLYYEIIISGTYLSLFFFLKLLPILGIFIGIILVVFNFLNRFYKSIIFLFHYFSFIYFLVPLNSQFLLKKLNFIGKSSFYLGDQGWIEIIGPFYFKNNFFVLKSYVSELQRNRLINFLYSFFIIIFCYIVLF